jgi:hypothetical protein
MAFNISMTDMISPVLRNMDKKNIRKFMKSGIAKAGRHGVSVIKTYYKTTGIKHNANSRKKNPASGIKYTIAKDDIANLTLRITGDYRLKWFEYGTVARYTKARNGTQRGKRKGVVSKRAYRGVMRKTPFFVPAIQNLKGQTEKIYRDAFKWALDRIQKQK